MIVVAVIPALDEEANIAAVVEGIRPFVDHVVVVDNGSTDATPERAAAAGADVVLEPRRGYGRACHAGLARAKALGVEVVLFMDGDGSDDPTDAPQILGPVRAGTHDVVLGFRDPARREEGSMGTVQRFGNWLAPRLMRLAVGARYRDMPPFKACTASALDRLRLTDQGHGFTIELLLRAHAERLRVAEVPVACRARAGGASKVSGTLRGTVRASLKIVTSIAKHAFVSRG